MQNVYISREEAVKALNAKGIELIQKSNKLKKEKMGKNEERAVQILETSAASMADAILCIMECKTYKGIKKEQTR